MYYNPNSYSPNHYNPNNYNPNYYNPNNYNPNNYNPNHYNSSNYDPDSYENIDVRQGTVQFFEHINATGSSFNVNLGNDVEYVGDVWNDKISSVRCPPRSLVALYEHRGFKGRVILLITRGNDSRVVNLHTHLDFNDQLSSIRTFRIC
ncbi:hypothetical protein IGW_05332 [Bacillus cereus ISP3191]|uniref:beta/gamma crystallin domain-containing protein n=1 Tax=Bacillus cereus TaxID=1396 RepID=UPI000279522F|nr:beta/gamma crystallin domain-containing protein [Bacillus cereus]EJQ86857.1 hypothetical protein IGW_05332 [Bacillus cereus ISP3191]MDR4319752.1 hypothetical protein [Bacillus paranthracis]